MHQTSKVSNDGTRAILLQSPHPRTRKRSPRSPNQVRKSPEFTSKSYRDGLQRAFNTAKDHIFFNPDMNLFITLTYAAADNTPEEVLYDVKQWLKRERRSRRVSKANVVQPKYIFIMEYQKRGSIHVHMIANSFMSLHVNRNGYRSISNWQKGFSSVLTVEDFDGNFKPYLYLFKYMRKAQRIGSSFIHTSRNLKSTYRINDPNIGINPILWKRIHTEYTKGALPDGTDLHFYRTFLHSRATIDPLIKVKESGT